MEEFGGCGLGLRSEFLDSVLDSPNKVDFFEVTPENWITTPTKYLRTFEKILGRFPVVAHGVSLSIGSDSSLDLNFLKKIKTFLDRYEIKIYSEHLSFASLDNRQSYELLPLPMTHSMIQRLCERIDFVQNYLQRPLVLENATYYYTPESQMSELEFINSVFQKSGAKMLLDINNVFVNSFNHRFDPYKFIDGIDLKNVSYYHMAGHFEHSDTLWIDSHGMPVKDEVFDLMTYTLRRFKAPVLLERDNNIPPYDELFSEYQKLKEIHDAL